MSAFVSGLLLFLGGLVLGAAAAIGAMWLLSKALDQAMRDELP